MTKRLLITLLTALLLPLTGFAYDFMVDGLCYNINNDGKTVTVTRKNSLSSNIAYDSLFGSLIIPSTVTYEGTTYSVTAIGQSAFTRCSSLTRVTIPNTVTSIGLGAFFHCLGLANVNIPNSITSIGISLFSDCSNLTSINIPNSITTIGNYAFSNCSSLANITIPKSVTSIGSDAFRGTPWYENQPDGLVYAGLVAYKDKGSMPSGTSIVIKDGTIGIAGDAFRDRSHLASVTIPNSVITIGDCAFYGCYGLKSIDIPNSVTTIGSSAFSGCSGLTSVTIPNSVTTIGSSAFSGCSGLTSVTIPNSVTTIGDYAFEKTPWYNNQPDGLVYAGLVAYKYKGTMPAGTNIVIKDGTKGVAGYAFSSCSGLTSVTIPNSVTSIGAEAFYGCSALTSVIIPNSVTSIGTEAFQGCSSLTSVIIGNSVTSIAAETFQGCSALTNVTIGISVTEIDNSAFWGCKNLTDITWNAKNCRSTPFSGWETTSCGSETIRTITFGDQVEVIPGDFAYNMTALTKVNFGKSVTSIGGWAFANCTELNDISIPESVTYVGTDAFMHTSWLRNQPDGLIYAGKVLLGYKGTMPLGTKVKLKEGTTQISYEAFGHDMWCSGDRYDYGYNCTEPFEIDIPNSVKLIDPHAFEGSGLTRVSIPDSVTKISYNAFANCSRLESINIPNSVTYIGSLAFENCTGLKSVSIPNSVTEIFNYAFSGCSGLTKVDLDCSLIGSCAFENCTNLTNATFGNSVNSIEELAFNGCSRLLNVTFGSSITYIAPNAFSGTPWYNNKSNGLIYVGLLAYIYKGTMPTGTSIVIKEGTKGINKYAFSDCSGLTSITIPKSVTSIGKGAFSGCTGLTSINVASDNPKYDSRNNCNAIIETASNTLMKGCNNTTIPNSIIEIDEYAFTECTGLTSVTIPKTVISIGRYAFAGCNGLKNIQSYPDPNKITLGRCAFYGQIYEDSYYDRYSANLHVLPKYKQAYSDAEPWNAFKIVDDLAEDTSDDLNGDGNVNAGDVSELYSAILRGAGDATYDLNNDGNVNAGDISSLYSTILGQ